MVCSCDETTVMTVMVIRVTFVCAVCRMCRMCLFQVPAFIYSESHIPEARRGTEYNGLMHVTDWLPTIATAAGIELNGA